MKKKTVGILVCTLLITSVLPVMGLEKDNETKVIHNTANEKCDVSFLEIQEDTLNIQLNDVEDISTAMLDQLDQQSTQSDKVKIIGASDEELAQSFTPTLPVLTRVILRLKSTFSAEFYYYYVDIKTSLLGSALTTAYISRDILIGGTGYYEFNFPDISVTPGNTYYIVLRGVSTSGDTSSVYWWYGYPDPYANGAAWYESISGWNYLQEGVQYCDYCFETYGEANNPPNTPSTPSGPSSGDVGDTLTYTSSTTDPDFDDVMYHLDINNDGVVDHSSGFYPSGATYTLHVTFYTAGTYYLRLKAEDVHGAQSGWSSSKTVTISGDGNNAPNTPSTPSGPSSGSVGVSYTYSTSATDPDFDQVKYYFDWDDGTGNWTSLVASGGSASASHSWGSAGTYQVRVKAQDEHGAESGWSSVLAATISAGNSPPNKPDTPSGPTSGKVFTSYTYTSSAIDPEGDKIYLMFDWGDGTDSGWLGLYNSGDTVTASHSWSMQGSYAIKVKAKDEHDVESVWSDPLPISMPKLLRFSVWDAFERINDWLLQVAGREILPEIFNL